MGRTEIFCGCLKEVRFRRIDCTHDYSPRLRANNSPWLSQQKLFDSIDFPSQKSIVGVCSWHNSTFHALAVSFNFLFSQLPEIGEKKLSFFLMCSRDNSPVIIREMKLHVAQSDLRIVVVLFRLS